jgi:hypothetical protein
LSRAHGDKSNPPELGLAIEVDENATDERLKSALERENAKSSGENVEPSEIASSDVTDEPLTGASATDSVTNEEMRQLSYLSLEDKEPETICSDTDSVETGATCADAGATSVDAGATCDNGAAEDTGDCRGDEDGNTEEPLSEVGM